MQSGFRIRNLQNRYHMTVHVYTGTVIKVKNNSPVSRAVSFEMTQKTKAPFYANPFLVYWGRYILALARVRRRVSTIDKIRKVHVSPITISLLKQLVCFSIRIVQELFNGSISLHVCMHIWHCNTIHISHK